MNIKKIFLISILIWILDVIFGWMTCGWLFSWIYEVPPMIWKSPEEIMSASTVVYSLFFTFIRAFIFVCVFALLYKGIPGTGAKKGFIYGVLVWLVGSFSGMMSMPLYMTIAPIVPVYWIIQALVFEVVFGMIIGGMYKIEKSKK